MSTMFEPYLNPPNLPYYQIMCDLLSNSAPYKGHSGHGAKFSQDSRKRSSAMKRSQTGRIPG